MNDGDVCARHYASKQPTRLSWRQGIITRVEPLPAAPEPDVWVAPALVDLQVNGFAGVDFQQHDLTAERLLVAARALRAAGCAGFLLTLVTDAWPNLTARLRRLRLLRSQSAELRQAILGWHIEGPFLSAQSGYHGAHNPELMLDPTPDHIRELRDLTQADPLLLTLAPERKGAREAISLARSLGLTVSLGHTNASSELLRQAVEAGATGFTHLGNACPPQLDRHDNILVRALDVPGLTVSLIPDAIHVPPALFRLIHRAQPRPSIYYVTDAMAAAGAPPGRYTIGPLQLEVGDDQIVRQPGKGNYAGSALRPIDGVTRAAAMLDCSWRDVWRGFSVGPAEFIGIQRDLAPGCPADFCLIGTDGAGQVASMRVFVGGE